MHQNERGCDLEKNCSGAVARGVGRTGTRRDPSLALAIADHRS
jgi:hypothetical protein